MNKHKRNISLVIADTQFLTNEALHAILSPVCNEIHTVTTKAGLLQHLRARPVSLIITDYVLFDYGSLDDLGDIKKEYPDTRIIVLCNAIAPVKIKELNDAGINNILLKTDEGDELFHVIDAAMKGKKYYSGNVLDILLKKDGPIEDASLLTATEIEVVRQIASGLSTKEIAVKKHISFHTVMTHRKNIFRKLGVSSSPELMMYSIKAGLIDNIEYHI
ncbi:MAG: response regulator transcription factor [Chlorobiaceae bacterium]